MNSHDILAAFRPVDVDDVWPTEARAAVRDGVLASTADVEVPAPASWVRRNRRWVALGTVAACLAAAGAFVSIALPSGAPGAPDAAAAATIQRLAVVAGEQGGVVRPGQFAYTRFVERNRADPAELSSPYPQGWTVVGEFTEWAKQRWVSPNGDFWYYMARGNLAPCLRGTPQPSVATPQSGSYADLPSAELAKLPTEPERLAAFLDAHPQGDDRGALNRFFAVSDFVRSGLATPELRAAALRVLAETDGVDVRTDVRDSLGRPATRVDLKTKVRVPPKLLFRYHRYTQSLFFDPATSRLLEQRSADGDGKLLGSTVFEESAIVDSVPTNLTPCPRVVDPVPDPATGG